MVNYIQNKDENELLLLRSDRKRRRAKEECSAEKTWMQ